MHFSRIASDKGIDTGDLDSGWDSARPFMRLIRARAGAARRKLRARNPIGLCVGERIHSPFLSLSLSLSLFEASLEIFVLSADSFASKRSFASYVLTFTQRNARENQFPSILPSRRALIKRVKLIYRVSRKES